jgi:hypothetical protein
MKAPITKGLAHTIHGVDEEADSLTWRLVRVGVVLGAMILFVLWAVL